MSSKPRRILEARHKIPAKQEDHVAELGEKKLLGSETRVKQGPDHTEPLDFILSNGKLP